METLNVLVAVIFGLILALGGLFAGLSLNNQAECEAEVITETIEVPVEVEVEKEVEKLVEVSDLDLAVEAFLDDLDLDEYESLRRVEIADDYVITGEKDKVTVEFSIEYQLVDSFTKIRTDFAYDVEVVFEEGEEVVIDY